LALLAHLCNVACQGLGAHPEEHEHREQEEQDGGPSAFRQVVEDDAGEDAIEDIVAAVGRWLEKDDAAD